MKCLLIVTVVLLSCCSEPTNPDLSVKSDLRNDRIYVDSVPRGAFVHLVAPSEDGQMRPAKVLGKTPLELDPSSIGTKKFFIRMPMTAYLEATKRIRKRGTWPPGFLREVSSVDRSLGVPRTVKKQLADIPFDTPESLVIWDDSGRINSLGPVYDLKWPKQNRLVAWFVPRKLDPSAFHELMPAAQTFTFDEVAFAKILSAEYSMSKQDASEATSSLSRCGKYFGTSNVAGVTRWTRITVQKGNLVLAQGRM